MNHPRNPRLMAVGAFLLAAGLVGPLVLVLAGVHPSPGLFLVMFAFPPPAQIVGGLLLHRFSGLAKKATGRPRTTYSRSLTLTSAGALLTLCGPGGIAFVVYAWRDLTWGNDNVGVLLLAGIFLLMIASMSASLCCAGIALVFANYPVMRAFERRAARMRAR